MKNTAYRIIGWIVFALCVAFVSVIMALCRFEYESALMIWLLGVAALISLPVCSLLHELGHVIFGAFTKIQARISLKSIFVFFKPSNCVIVPHCDKNVKKRLIVTALGGLIVNLIFVILGVIAIFVSALPTYLAILTPASLYLFVINALPADIGGNKTDALLIVEVLKEEDSAKVLLAVLTVQAQVLNGKPVEEVDEELLFNLPQIQEDDPAFISLTELRAMYFSAKCDEEQAQKYSARLEQLKADYLN